VTEIEDGTIEENIVDITMTIVNMHREGIESVIQIIKEMNDPPVIHDIAPLTTAVAHLIAQYLKPT
jgi:hypothetical protein